MSQPRSNRFSRAGDAPEPAPLLIVPSLTPLDDALPAAGASTDRGGGPAALAHLVRDSEQMDDAEGLDELWTVVAAGASRFLGTRAKVMRWTGQHWLVLSEHPEDGARVEPDTDTAEVPPAGGERSATLDPQARTAYAQVIGHARSVLVADLECAALSVPTRLVWTSSAPNAFNGATERAAEYARFCSGAVGRTHTRVHLQRAVTARHRIGQAQGILMARLELDAAAAFEVLVRLSQHTNVKLSVLAQLVIDDRGLESVTRGQDRHDRLGVADENLPPDAVAPSEGPAEPLSLRVEELRTDAAVLLPELSDALSEAVVTGTDGAAGRAEVMCAVVEELRSAAEWLNDADCRDELQSLQATVAAVREHLALMLRLSHGLTS